MPKPPFAGCRVVLAVKFDRRAHQSGMAIRAGLEELRERARQLLADAQGTAVMGARGRERALGEPAWRPRGHDAIARVAG